MPSPQPSIAFFGSSEFSLPSLKALANQRYRLMVVSQPARPQGRRLKVKANPLAALAQELDLPLFTPENVNDSHSLATLLEFAPDIIVTASYGSIFRKPLLELAQICINLHPSLLPLLRGATPIQSALLQGFAITGVSIFAMAPKMDAGDILIQEETPIHPLENHSQLEERLADMAARLLLGYISDPQAYPPVPQDHTLATYSQKIDRNSTLIDWNQPCRDIHNQIRAFAMQPGAWTTLTGKQLKILAAQPSELAPTGKPGELANIEKNKGFAINTGDTPLFIQTVQPQGKKVMDAWAFHLGARLKPAIQFGS